MAKSIGTLKASLILDTSQWLGGFAKAGGVTKSFFGGIASKVGGAIGGIVSVGAAFHSLSQGMNQVDRQAKLADRLGITVGEVQKLSLAADLAGTDIELLARSMLKMGKNIGSGGQSLDKRLFQVADAIALIKDPGERAAKAEEIFGKGGLELINTLIQGGQGIRNSANAIDRYELAISRVDAAKVEAANDAWTEMTTVLAGLRNELAVGVSPAFTSLVQNMTLGLGLLNSYMEQLTEQTKVFANTLLGAAALMRGDFANVFTSGLNVLQGESNVKDILRRRQDIIIGGVGAQIGGRAGGGGLGVFGGAAGGGGTTAGSAERGSVEAARVIAATQSQGEKLDEVAAILRAINAEQKAGRMAPGAAFGLARL